jgi:RNA polymerase-binding transcription factor DksA
MPKDHKLNVELSVYELYLLEEALQDHAGDLQHDAQVAQVAKAETDRAELLALRASEASELRTKLDAIKRANYG